MNSPGGVIVQVGADAEVQSSLLQAFQRSNHSVEAAPDLAWVLSRLSETPRLITSVVIAALPAELSTLETLRQIRRLRSDVPVIFTAKEPSPSLVAAAFRNGATDFLQQPVSTEGWRTAIGSAAGWRRQKVTDSAQSTAAAPKSRMEAIDSTLELVAASDVPVLIQGETGSGKEVLARRVHAASGRARKPFVKLNCAALPSELVESELFGYERGAFTGAYQRKPGIFEAAQGGTILLDEIGDMDVRLQAKLLQVLQDHEFQRIGGKETIRVDVRVIAATHRDLERAVEQGEFREDLYYRLNVVNLTVPPLRERKDDIPELFEILVKKHARPDAPIPPVTRELQEAILEWHWPGNVRELENFVRKFLIFQDADALVRDLHSRVRRSSQPDRPQPEPPPAAEAPREAQPDGIPALHDVNAATRQAEIDAIVGALEVAHWNRKHASALLEIDYKALLYKMKKLGIGVSNRRPETNGAAAAAGSAY